MLFFLKNVGPGLKEWARWQLLCKSLTFSWHYHDDFIDFQLNLLFLLLCPSTSAGDFGFAFYCFYISRKSVVGYLRVFVHHQENTKWCHILWIGFIPPRVPDGHKINASVCCRFLAALVPHSLDGYLPLFRQNDGETQFSSVSIPKCPDPFTGFSWVRCGSLNAKLANGLH